MYNDVKRLIETVRVEVQYTYPNGILRSSDGLERTQVDATVTLKVVLRNYKPSVVGGLVQEGTKECILSSLNLSFVPRQGDKIKSEGDTYIVKSVTRYSYKNEAIVYRLRVEGRNRNGS